MMDKPAVIIDNGSDTCKIGLSHPELETEPICFKSAVEKESSGNYRTSYLGNESLKFNSPITHGKILNWDDMISVWENGFKKELRISSSEQPCLLTEAVQQSLAQREKTAEIMFEHFNVPAFSLKKCELLSLICSGRTTGLVLNVGHSLTSSVPIIEGYIGHMMAIESVNFGGEDITNYLFKILDRKLPSEFFNKRFKICREIKENFCEFTNNETSENSFELPDGTFIAIGSEKHQSPEIIFNPLLIGKDPGLLKLALKSIEHYQKEETRRDLCRNIVLSGGSSMIKGFSERILEEMTRYLPSTFLTKCIKPPQDLKTIAWLGGSMLASLDCFQKFWITRAQYEESGKGIIHRAY